MAMSGRPGPSRVAAAKAAAARNLARARRARVAREVLEKAKGARKRGNLGPLRERVLQPRTLKRYIRQVQAFFTWVEKSGKVLPDRVIDFDTLLCDFAEALWSEGYPKGLLNGALCSFAHFVPSLRGQLCGSWRFYKAWGRTEKPVQAPPLGKGAMRAIAGWFQRRGFPHAATMIVLAFHHILRSCEMFDILPLDVYFDGGVMMVTPCDTKMGQRLGINQDIIVTSRWLARRVQAAADAAQPGTPLLGMQPRFFRNLWKQACRAIGLPGGFTPYSLRRG